MHRNRHVTLPPWPCRSERGAIIIHVGFALLVLIGFSAFVVDQGVRLVSRSQAQNGADAGAMAAAIALGLDDFNDRTTSGPAVQAGQQFALTHLVWGAPPDVTLADVTFPACPDDGSNACVRVDVYRNQARSNPLPSYFGQLLGVTDQGVKATATAKTAIANASECLKPWALPDKWFENTAPPFGVNSSYDRRFHNGPNKGQLIPLPRDEYVAPTDTSVGSGYTFPADVGTQARIQAGIPQNTIGPGLFYPVRLCGGLGAADFIDNIQYCCAQTYQIEDMLPFEPGAMVGPTRTAVLWLISQDPSATFNTTTNSVQNSCAPGPCGLISPRIVTIPVFDTEKFDEIRSEVSSTKEVEIVNFLGFFVDAMVGNEVRGYFMRVAGTLVSGGPGVGEGSAFQRVTILVR